tara:strand:- start:1075 stop:1341 length:267 start_codon:yes stop_codon:yes gene_type:complete
MTNETTMEEWVDDYEYMFHRGESHSPYAKTTHKVDKIMRFCTKCKMCWERYYNAKGKNWTKYPKNHIPIINKNRELCPSCKSSAKERE